METGAKTGYIVMEDQTQEFPTTPAPTSSRVRLRMNGLHRFRQLNSSRISPIEFKHIIMKKNSKGRFVFCGELCLADGQSCWRDFMITLHSLLLVSFTITLDSKVALAFRVPDQKYKLIYHFIW